MSATVAFGEDDFVNVPAGADLACRTVPARPQTCDCGSSTSRSPSPSMLKQHRDKDGGSGVSAEPRRDLEVLKPHLHHVAPGWRGCLRPEADEAEAELQNDRERGKVKQPTDLRCRREHQHGNRSVRDWTEGRHIAVIVMQFGASQGWDPCKNDGEEGTSQLGGVRRMMSDGEAEGSAQWRARRSEARGRCTTVGHAGGPMGEDSVDEVEGTRCTR